jgi:hypothetical protein
MNSMHVSTMSARQPVEHVIGYAYPSSPRAQQLGFSKTGCFTVEVAGRPTPVGSYHEAKMVVDRLGTVPGRWSMDHPSNSHLIQHHVGGVATLQSPVYS